MNRSNVHPAGWMSPDNVWQRHQEMEELAATQSARSVAAVLGVSIRLVYHHLRGDCRCKEAGQC